MNTGQTPAQERTIRNSLDELEKAQRELIERIVMLESQLEPVLRPADQDGMNAANPKSQDSQVLQHILTINEFVVDATHRIIDLASRLQI